MKEADREAGFRVYADSYGAGPTTVASLAEVSLDNRWVAEDAGRVVGILRELPVQQGFGGRFVASHGVGAVAVALEARSRGVGRELMSSFLRSMHERAVPLSVLYASTLAAYRPVGYELAGVRVRYEVPLEHLPRSQPLAVEPWDEDDLSEVDDCLNRIALANNGMMSRPDWWWQQNVFNPLDEDAYLYRYRVQEGNRTTGYLVYTSPTNRGAICLFTGLPRMRKGRQWRHGICSGRPRRRPGRYSRSRPVNGPSGRTSTGAAHPTITPSGS